jgi:hypothetical protein
MVKETVPLTGLILQFIVIVIKQHSVLISCACQKLFLWNHADFIFLYIVIFIKS